MRKMPNWKAPGPDNVQGYWLKNLTPLHDKLIVYLQDCLDSGVVPDGLISQKAHITFLVTRKIIFFSWMI